jgi:hypothetical protein
MIVTFFPAPALLSSPPASFTQQMLVISLHDIFIIRFATDMIHGDALQGLRTALDPDKPLAALLLSHKKIDSLVFERLYYRYLIYLGSNEISLRLPVHVTAKEGPLRFFFLHF